MNKHNHFLGLIKLFLLGLLAVVLLGTEWAVQAQEKADPKAQPKAEPRAQPRQPRERLDAEAEGLRLRSFVREGFTRPGNPPDTLTDKGTIKRVAFEVGYKGVGGTVYFAVLRLSGEEGDAWSTGVTNFDGSFVPGLDIGDTTSPPLDTRARYLYLYQVVNDRGLEPMEIRPAATTAINGESIYSVSVALTVDPRYITSWGHFTREGFAIKAADRKMDGEIAQVVAPGDEPAESIIAVSSNPSVVGKLPEQRFRVRSPAYRLRNWLSVNSATVGLKKSFAVSKLEKDKAGGVKLAAWGDEMIQSAKKALNPDFVQLTYVDWREPGERALEGEAGDQQPNDQQSLSRRVLTFRAEFLKKNLVALARHSVVFGFTSDLPPTDTRVLLTGATALEEPGAIIPAAQGPGDPGVGAVGTVPAPTPPALTPAAGGAGVSGSGTLGGQAGGVGGGGIGGFPALGGLGGARGSTGGGGGGLTGGGTGGGQQGTQQKQPQDQNQNTGNDQNININNINAQAQLQAQQQQQQQQQNQNGNCGCTPGNVVPEPGAIILSLLGLPALFYCCRRRKVAEAAASGG